MAKRKKKNDQIAASQVAAPDMVPSRTLPPPERPEPRDLMEYEGLAAQIAQDHLAVRNSRWDGAADDFPFEPQLRTCAKFFRDAKGGPLYIDEPQTPRDLAECKRKAEKIRARGLRYVYIWRDPETGLDPEIEDVLGQLVA